jgi:hypothetical protein
MRAIRSRGKKWEGHLTRIDEKRNTCRFLVGKPGGKRALRIPRRRLDDNIRIFLKEIGWEDFDLINQTQDKDNRRALLNTVKTLGFYNMR